MFWLGVVLAVLGAVRAARPCGRWELPGSSSPAQGSSARSADVPAEAQQSRVVRIVDGDTIIVAVDRPGGPVPPGDNHRVRLLEIDTPESVKPNYPVECGGTNATAFAKKELPAGSTVYLLADRQDKDGFGRYLRYAWDSEGEFYNEKAVAEGYARAVLYQPNDLYIDRIRR
ncbi:MAG TPA: thermonuclease family protein, partial [Actinomycetota bacterium]|nr:thermonuclease family protein [Actinomycetota bacterium]